MFDVPFFQRFLEDMERVRAVSFFLKRRRGVSRFLSCSKRRRAPAGVRGRDGPEGRAAVRGGGERRAGNLRGEVAHRRGVASGRRALLRSNFPPLNCRSKSSPSAPELFKEVPIIMHNGKRVNFCQTKSNNLVNTPQSEIAV